MRIRAARQTRFWPPLSDRVRPSRQRLGVRWQAQRDTAFARSATFRKQMHSRTFKSAVAASLCRSTLRSTATEDGRTPKPRGISTHATALGRPFCPNPNPNLQLAFPALVFFRGHPLASSLFSVEWFLMGSQKPLWVFWAQFHVETPLLGWRSRGRCCRSLPVDWRRCRRAVSTWKRPD
jgi:hypothetical protein